MKLLTLCLWALTGSSQVAPKPTDPFKEGVVILRILNTVQAELKAKGGAFVPLSVVLEAPMLRSGFSEASLAEPSKAVVDGRSLVFVLSDDRKHYQATVLPAESCGMAAFTNESGLIYSGRALGCEK